MIKGRIAAPSERGMTGFSSWREFVVDSFPWLVVDQGSTEFHASAKFRVFGDGSLAAMTSDACRVTRDRVGVRRADAGHLKVMWQRAGTMGVEQDGRESLLTAGITTICDTARPYRLTLSAGARLVVLTLPYRALLGWERVSESVCGTVMKDRAVFGAALAASLVLLDDAADATDEGAGAILHGVQSMLSLSLRRSMEPRHRSSIPLQLDGVQEHIMAHLDDPNLSPDELATALRVSRRTLYQLFKEQSTTPSRFIREVRLDAVRQALLESENAHKSILEISLDHGFADSASFCRTFKAAYGVRPSAWRSRAMTRSEDE